MKKQLLAIIQLVLIVTIQGCQCKSATQKPTSVSNTNYEVNSQYYDSSLSNSIAKYRDSISKNMNRVIGFSDETFTKKHASGKLDSFFVKTIMDFCLETWKDSAFLPNIFLFNTGGLRNSISSGPITVGNIFELMPFNNSLVVFEMDGKFLPELVESMKKRGGDPFMAFGQIFNKKDKYDFLQLIKFDTNRKYMVVTSDYLLDRGDDIIKPEYLSKIRFESSILIRDALILQIKNSNE